MLKIIFVLLSVCLSVGQSFSQTKSLLYKITGKGIQAPSYIYGSIHIICSEDLIVRPEVKQAFDACNHVLMELDMDDPTFMMKMQQASVNTDGTKLTDHLNEDEEKLINDFLMANYGMGLGAFNALKPFLVASLVMAKMVDCAQPASYEMTFVNMAKEKKIEVSGLESVQEQINIFDAIPIKEQIKITTEVLQDTAQSKAYLRKMISTYKLNDAEALFKVIQEDPQYENSMDVLLDDRNEKWIPDIIKYIHEQPTFIVVGGAHLGGDKSVLALLKRAGYTLEAVN